MLEAHANTGGEVYKLTCPGCQRTVQIPTAKVLDGVGHCPMCGGRLLIDWGALRDEQQPAPTGQSAVKCSAAAAAGGGR